MTFKVAGLGMEIILKDLKKQIRALAATMRAKFNRRVPVGDLLTDRWEIARDYGFGEGTSCYDNVLILGDVSVGKHTWIGPNVVLDGSGGGLSIGDHCSVSAGVQIYTHNTVKWSLTGGDAPKEEAPTIIGSNVYIGPGSVISMGVRVGNGVIIGALSFVNKDIPDFGKFLGGRGFKPLNEK